MKFEEKLIKLRKEKLLSQEELGEKLDVTRQTISKWELGQSKPDMEKLKEISTLFNISIEELTNDEIDISKKNKSNGNNKNTIIIVIAVIAVLAILVIGVKVIVSNIVLKEYNDIKDRTMQTQKDISDLFNNIKENVMEQQNNINEEKNEINNSIEKQEDVKNKIIEQQDKMLEEFNKLEEKNILRNGANIWN